VPPTTWRESEAESERQARRRRVRSREVREGGEREGGKTDGAEEGEEKKDSRPAIVEWRVEDISSQQD